MEIYRINLTFEFLSLNLISKYNFDFYLIEIDMSETELEMESV